MSHRWKRSAIVAIGFASLLPAVANAAFHQAVIDEVMTSYGGDPSKQFVEIRMLSGGQTVVGGSVLAAFDTGGSYTGDVLTVPTDIGLGGAGVRWIMATSSLATAAGITADFTFTAGLPVSGGMVCWGKPTVHSNPDQYVDCLAYGTYSGPTNTRIGSPTALDPVGHSLQRTTAGMSFNNASDFACGDPATPTNNAGSSGSLAATTPCPVCGNNVKEAGEVCDGTDAVACPGLCNASCRCANGLPFAVPSIPSKGLMVFVALVIPAGAWIILRQRPRRSRG